MLLQLAKPFLRTLDRMRCGGVVLDANGSVLEANAEAFALLKREMAPTDTEPIQDWGRRAIKRLLVRAGSRFRIDEEAWITVSRQDSPPLVLHAVPIANDTLEGPHTVLVLVDLQYRPHPAPNALQRLFNLTPAEAKLAIEIGFGKTLSAIADETGVSTATLRTQLSSIFNKTQTRRQPELVALLVRVAILP